MMRIENAMRSGKRHEALISLGILPRFGKATAYSGRQNQWRI